MKDIKFPIASRRRFLKGAAAATIVQSSAQLVSAAARDSAPGRRIIAYVGTYTLPGQVRGNGEGIYRFVMDPETGELSSRTLAAKTPNPSWLMVHPSHPYLYAINEISDFDGTNGSLSAFAINPATGDLDFLNAKSTKGAGPAYSSIDGSGKFALVANYVGGSVAVLPILDGGRLGDAVDTHQDSGSLGAQHATDGPPGSFAVSGHDAPHAHIILADPSNRFVLSTDLGQDRIYVYRFNPNTGKLAPNLPQPFVSLPSGDGPRHLAFHPGGHWLYSIQEEASTLAFFHFDPSTGRLTGQQTISTLPPGYAGTSFASEVLLSASGAFLYAGNRLSNTIGVFSVAADGRLTLCAETPSMGDYPHQLRIAPGGRFLYACNLRSDNITSFRIDQRCGTLHFTGQYVPAGTPGSIVFAT